MGSRTFVMAHQDSIRLLVVGTGPVGRAHLACAASLGVKARHGYSPSGRQGPDVIALGARAHQGDLTAVIGTVRPTHVVVAVPHGSLAAVTERLLRLGCRRILVEKPGALHAQELETLARLAEERNASVTVAYNRRHFGVAIAAMDILAAWQEPVETVRFEFGQRRGEEAPPGISPQGRRRWLLAHGAHVIDLAFLPTGLPVADRSRFHREGSLPWHPTAAAFAGEGLTTSGARFEYVSDWRRPGPWSIRWETRTRLLELQPLEQGKWRYREAPAWLPLTFCPSPAEPKPGFLAQLGEFLNPPPRPRSPDLPAATALARLVEAMGGYFTVDGNLVNYSKYLKPAEL